jgi:cytochrome P450
VAAMGLPPGPRMSSVRQLLEYTVRPLPFFDRCIRDHGELFTMSLAGLGEFVLCGSPRLVKQAFTADPAVLQAGRANRILEPLVGSRSMLLLDGAEHLRQRRLLLPPLHGERMQAYARLMSDVTRAAIERWPSGTTFSLHPHMQAITLEVILRAVFGVEDAAALSTLRPLLVELMTPPPAIMAFLPALQVDLPLSPFRRFLRRRAAVHRELFALIARRRSAPDLAGRSDVLSLLLAARDEAGAPLSDEELRDELVTMLVAGHETTATALSWAFALILADPRVAERLAAEATDDPEALARAPYLDAVIKETLRLRPIVPDVVREVRAPWTVDGHELPIGCYVTPFIYAVHRDPELYPDPERFRPERFLDVKPDPYTWFPFGGGTRRCVGMAFALYEMKIVLGTILSRARLRLADAEVKVVRRTLTFAPSGGTRVVVS